jgi:hypothetical protein
MLCCVSSVRNEVTIGQNPMRHRDPREDQPRKRRPEPYRGPPVTLGHVRSHGVRHLLIYCSTGLCHHSAVVNADRWSDDIDA